MLNKEEIKLMERLLSVTATITNIYQNLYYGDKNYQSNLEKLKLAVSFEDKLIKEIYQKIDIKRIFAFLQLSDQDSLNPKVRLHDKFVYYHQSHVFLCESDYQNNSNDLQVKLELIGEVLKAQNITVFNIDHLKNNYYYDGFNNAFVSDAYYEPYIEQKLLNNQINSIVSDKEISYFSFLLNIKRDEIKEMLLKKYSLELTQFVIEIANINAREIDDFELEFYSNLLESYFLLLEYDENEMSLIIDTILKYQPSFKSRLKYVISNVNKYKLIEVKKNLNNLATFNEDEVYENKNI